MPPDAPDRLVRRVFALMRDARIGDRRDRLALYRWILHDPSINSTNDLDEHDLKTIASMMETWQRHGELERRAREKVDEWNKGER